MSKVDHLDPSTEVNRVQNLIDEISSSDTISKEIFQSIRGLIYQPPHFRAMHHQKVSEIKALVLVLTNLLRDKGWEELADDLLNQCRQVDSDDLDPDKVRDQMVQDFRDAMKKSNS